MHDIDQKAIVQARSLLPIYFVSVQKGDNIYSEKCQRNYNAVLIKLYTLPINKTNTPEDANLYKKKSLIEN